MNRQNWQVHGTTLFQQLMVLPESRSDQSTEKIWSTTFDIL